MIDLTGKKAEFITSYIEKILAEQSQKYPSKAEIARALGVMPQYLNTVTSGRRNVSDRFFKKFTELFGINPKDLQKLEVEISNDEIFQSKKIDSPRIPLVGIEAIGGFGGTDFAIQKQDIKDFYEVPDFNNVDFMIRVKGSSMYPKYNSGDVVACRIIKESNFIQWNKVHVIATKEQGILIKRIKKGGDENLLKAVSDNIDYDPFEIPKAEITGIALVIGVIRLE